MAEHDEEYGYGVAPEAPDPGPQGGDDHPRRGGQIAGEALGGLLDRVVYLESIVSTRENTIADLDLQLLELEHWRDKHNHEIQNLMGAHGRDSACKDRIIEGFEFSVRAVVPDMRSIFDRAQGRPVGKAARPIKAIESHVASLSFDLAQADRHRRGFKIQYDDFEE